MSEITNTAANGPSTEVALQARYEHIRASIANRLIGIDNDTKEMQRTMDSQNIFQRWGGNEKSMIEQNEVQKTQLLQVRSKLESLWTNAKTIEVKAAVLQMIVGVEANGQPTGELFKASPNFAKLRQEFDRTEKIINITEQGLQYAQTALEIAASYAGPPGIAASLIPKYIVELTTGQTTPQSLAWRIVEDVLTAYVGSGKVAKASLTRLGPVGNRVAKIFETANKQGWTKATAVEKTIVEFVEVFRDTGIQNLFAEVKEQITGDKAHKVSIVEMAGGKVIGKVIGKGLEKTGISGRITSIVKSGNIRAQRGSAELQQVRDEIMRLPENEAGRALRIEAAEQLLSRTLRPSSARRSWRHTIPGRWL